MRKLWKSVCVCLCVCERERERERLTAVTIIYLISSHSFLEMSIERRAVSFKK